MDFKKRKRNIFSIDSNRQLLVVLENYETDICDFLSLLLIVIIEVEKIQKYIKNYIPTTRNLSIFDMKSSETIIGLKDSELLKALQYIFKKSRIFQ